MACHEKNSKSPRAVPWGTPDKTDTCSESVSLAATRWVLLRRESDSLISSQKCCCLVFHND